MALARGGLRNSHCIPNRLWVRHSIGLAPHPHLRYRHQRDQARHLQVASQKRRSSPLAKDAVLGKFVAMVSFHRVKVALRPVLIASRLIGLEIIMYRAGEELRTPKSFFFFFSFCSSEPIS